MSPGPNGKPSKPPGLSKKERLRLPQQVMPEQPAEVRIRNMSEVPLGFSSEQAIAEAARCLECPKPKCVAGCPVGIDIPRFIRQVADGDFAAAVATIRERNLLPAICGRVCPQEDQCQVVCAVTAALRRRPAVTTAMDRMGDVGARWRGGRALLPLAMLRHSTQAGSGRACRGEALTQSGQTRLCGSVHAATLMSQSQRSCALVI